ncbi:Inhibitor of the KinA pathway to sporulation, predicted exonuclease [Pseudomonas linyingensis]|uniref:Inhibitor of the KinA pathway to sporulation, predicted exonuclease n=1 Tax=Pseudomonas linyingensis TaxID=915471 RepID=A0A1H6V664_9PSED|nr:3'-5' exonuclease [Pseudomonas linyingensis]SEI95705.1 Inhibitor of the KinA pathway to sporulation, predicted exonuclease [Pseudomonas linyingensis]
MKHWLVIDLEATTDDGGWPIEDMEIIEIGAVVVDEQGREQDHFQSFVRPTHRPQLTAFCRQLTHIRQADVDDAPTLHQLQARFEPWLQQHLDGLQGWLSWGNYDRQQFEIEWRRQQIASCLAGLAHFNLKKLFNRQFKDSAGRKQVGLNRALEQAGLEFRGTQHRGIDDARNIARLLPLTLPTLAAARLELQRAH